jgi:hypothetical protein
MPGNATKPTVNAIVRDVGPFVFADHMGPHTFPPGEAVDVRPHPHIGLATITWLWECCFTHRDSLGFEQDILPGEVNWMIAGRGSVHSERIEQAKADWREGRFAAIPGETELIPLPD